MIILLVLKKKKNVSKRAAQINYEIKIKLSNKKLNQNILRFIKEFFVDLACKDITGRKIR